MTVSILDCCAEGQVNLNIDNHVSVSIICSGRASGIKKHHWVEIALKYDERMIANPGLLEGMSPYFCHDDITRLDVDELIVFLTILRKLSFYWNKHIILAQWIKRYIKRRKSLKAFRNGRAGNLKVIS